MRALTEAQIRAAFVNASLRERKELTLPPRFAETDWEAIDFLGWRDPKLPRVGYLVIPAESEADDAVGIMLRLGDRQPRTRPQCSFCEDVQLPNDVAFYSAKRAGAAGRKGDTVGTLICAEFQCSANVRVAPSKIFADADREAIRGQRIATLRQRVGGFARRVLGE